MLTSQHRQELISRAYVAAVAASVGMNSSIRDLDYGIDLTLHQVTSRTSRKTGKTRIVESGLTLPRCHSFRVRLGEESFDGSYRFHCVVLMSLFESLTPMFLLPLLAPPNPGSRKLLV
jgi:hypothetical protein